MKTGSKTKGTPKADLVCGLFSKQEAARLIADGTLHVHSSTLGARDAYARVTEESLKSGSPVPYPWEHPKTASASVVRTSKERHSRVAEILGALGIDSDQKLKDRVGCVLEELISNAIYHGYKRNGENKYARSAAVTLAANELVTVRYQKVDHGVYLSVQDQGGTVTPGDIGASFDRCYKKDSDQVSAKESGAGLGLYMAFEFSTHVKVEVWPGQKTIVSCWLSDKRTFDPDLFSFNYYEWR